MPNKDPLNVAAIQMDTKTGTATSGAATANGTLCRITSEDLTTAAGAEYTLTLTNNVIKADSVIFVSTHTGTSTQGTLATGEALPAAGQVTITVSNTAASDALNGTIVIDVLVLNPAGTQ